jgi:hypothetical protein
VSEGGVGMMNLNFAQRFHSPLSHRGRVREGEHSSKISQSVKISGLPGVARRLVTFFCFAKKKVTKEKATPIRHLFEVPCVARLVRRLRNSHDPLRVHVLKQSWLRHNLKVSLHRNKSLRAVLSPPSPDQSPLLGGGTGEGKAKPVQRISPRDAHTILRPGFIS